jgi:plastocyanin
MRKIPRRRFVVALPVVPAVVAACGNSGRDLGALVSTTTTASTASTVSTEPSTSLPTLVVEITTAAGFVPKDSTTPSGSQLQFSCPDGGAHTISSDAGAPVSFIARLTAAAPTSIVSLPPTGVVGFHCELHENETGTVTVA